MCRLYSPNKGNKPYQAVDIVFLTTRLGLYFNYPPLSIPTVCVNYLLFVGDDCAYEKLVEGSVGIAGGSVVFSLGLVE